MRRGRSGLRALAVGLPVILGSVAACGDDSPTAGRTDPAVSRGQELARTRGCSACHGADGQGDLGPAWAGVLGTTVTFTDGSTATIDEAYLTSSIVEPDAQIVEGFAVKMPKTELTDAEVADLVAYIVSLSG